MIPFQARKVKPETEWLRFVRQRLRLAFGPSIRMIKVMGGLGQEPGISDLICCIQGRAVAIELKTPGGRYGVTGKQQAFLESWSRAGGVALVIDSPDSLEALIKQFTAVQGRLF
jgi:hypothetical protein